MDGQVGGTPPGAFERQMRVSPDPDVPGRYHVDVDARRNFPAVPQGGFIAAPAASAIAREIDRPDQRLRTLSTVSSSCAAWYRFAEPPLRPDGTLDPLAAVALSDVMPSAVGCERIGPGGVDLWGPSADLTVHLLGEARSGWLLSHRRAHRATAGCASVASDPVGHRGHAGGARHLVDVPHLPGGPPEGDARLPADQRR